MARLVWLLTFLVACGDATGAAAQAPPGAELCEGARAFLSEDLAMLVETEADTIADARTNRLLPGCRITAAGGTPFQLGEAAAVIYDQLAAEGWSRTPIPRDVPSRGARRLRKLGTDCLFYVYRSTVETIGSDAQVRVNRAFRPYGQDERFNVLVQCVPALPPAFGAP